MIETKTTTHDTRGNKMETSNTMYSEIATKEIERDILVYKAVWTEKRVGIAYPCLTETEIKRIVKTLSLTDIEEKTFVPTCAITKRTMDAAAKSVNETYQKIWNGKADIHTIGNFKAKSTKALWETIKDFVNENGNRETLENAHYAGDTTSHCFKLV